MQKEKLQQVVVDLPEEVDVDSLVEKLYLLDKIEMGERQLARGEGIPHEEAKKRLEKWPRRG
jgi:predicted transcriptional regulator